MRQLSVQQQNFEAEEGIRRVVAYWRNHPLPRALFETASARGFDCHSMIVLKLEVDFPGMPGLFGTLVAAEGRFVEFEIDIDKSHNQVEGATVCLDSTDQQDVGLHNRGTGIGAGAIALKVLREFNATA